MRRGLLLTLSILFLLIANTPASAELPEPVKFIVIDGVIDGGYADLVSRQLSIAAEAEPIIIYLRTNGGYLKPTQDIVTAILESRANVTIFIPRGGFAFSAGAYIALSAETLAMAPGSSIGSAEPRDLAGEADPKVRNAMASYIKSIAEARGRNASLAEKMVTENLNLSAEEAVKYGVADLIVEDLEELFTVLGLSGRPVERIDKDIRSHLLSLVTDPLLLGIFLNIAALLILLELFNPTYIGLIVAAALLTLSFLGLGILGADATAIALLIIGAFAIVLETWVGEGELAVAGAILTIFGIFLLYRGEMFIWTFNQRLLVIGGLIILGIWVSFFGYYIHKIRETLMMRESPLEKKRIIGMSGVVKKDIKPGEPGVVLVEGDLWTAVSDVEIPEGARVRVVDIDGLTLKVEPINQDRSQGS